MANNIRCCASNIVRILVRGNNRRNIMSAIRADIMRNCIISTFATVFVYNGVVNGRIRIRICHCRRRRVRVVRVVVVVVDVVVAFAPSVSVSMVEMTTLISQVETK